MGRFPDLGGWRRFEKPDREIVDEALAVTHLTPLANRQINALSGGRVELPAVQSLGLGYFNLLADGVDSVVDLSGVSSEDTANSVLAVEARNQGQIALPLVDGVVMFCDSLTAPA